MLRGVVGWTPGREYLDRLRLAQGGYAPPQPRALSTSEVPNLMDPANCGPRAGLASFFRS